MPVLADLSSPKHCWQESGRKRRDLPAHNPRRSTAFASPSSAESLPPDIPYVWHPCNAGVDLNRNWPVAWIKVFICGSVTSAKHCYKSDIPVTSLCSVEVIVRRRGKKAQTSLEARRRSVSQRRGLFGLWRRTCSPVRSSTCILASGPCTSPGTAKRRWRQVCR